MTRNNAPFLHQYALWTDILGTGNKLKDPYYGKDSFKNMIKAKVEIERFQYWTIELFRYFKAFEGCIFSDGLSVKFTDISEGISFLRILFKVCFCNNIWLRAGISIGNNWQGIDKSKYTIPSNLQIYSIVSDAHYEAYKIERDGPAGMKILTSSMLASCITKGTVPFPQTIRKRTVKFKNDNKSNTNILEICWTSPYTTFEKEIVNKLSISSNIIRDETIFCHYRAVFLDNPKNHSDRPSHHFKGTMNSFSWHGK